MLGLSGGTPNITWMAYCFRLIIIKISHMVLLRAILWEARLLIKYVSFYRSYGEMAHTHILVEFSILRFSIISIVHIPFNIF